MEPHLVPYSPILHRPKLRWPGDARVALWVVPNIEHYEYLPDFVRTRDPWPRSPHPDVLGYAQRDYGNRVGLWRLFELTDALDVRCTVSLNMAVHAALPGDPRARWKQRGWEYMSHGIYNTRYHWDFSADEERAAMEECQESTSASPAGGYAAGSARRSPTRCTPSISPPKPASTTPPTCITTTSRSR